MLSFLQQDDRDPAVLQCWSPHLALLWQSVSAGMRCWLLLHPVLRRRPTGCGPLLPQLQSAPGHLQALVGLGQSATVEVVDNCYQKSPDPCPAQPEELDVISSWAPSSCLLGGGKGRKSNKPPSPETAAGVVPCTCEDVDLGCCLKGFLPAHVTPLTVIVTPFASPLLICHWCQSQAPKPQFALFFTVWLDLVPSLTTETLP